MMSLPVTSVFVSFFLMGGFLLGQEGGFDAAPEEFLKDRLLVRLTVDLPGSGEGPLTTTGDLELDAHLQHIGVQSTRRIFHHPPRGWRNAEGARRAGLDRWILLEFGEDRENLEGLCKALSTWPSIERCERSQLGSIATTIPNDPRFNEQWSLQNDFIRAPEAWDIQRDSDQIVAVIDTGVDLDHPDLVAQLWRNPNEIPNNGIDDDLNGFVDDIAGWDFSEGDNDPEDLNGHGTHCSGIVGADANNELIIAGVCWDVTIMPVSCFDRYGSGPMSGAAAAIVYAADNGANILSNSWGYTADVSLMADAVAYAASLDVVNVAAAHNQDRRVRMYPAAYPEVMGIMATNDLDQRAGFSNYGPWYDMTAPGTKILSLFLNGGTRRQSGTSMATPHVAGAAALVRTLNPSLDAVDTRWVLNYSAFDLGNFGFDEHYGWGRLDLLAALERAQTLRISSNVAQPGSSVTLDVALPQDRGYISLLLPSLYGRAPGTKIDLLRQFPLNFDPLLFPFVLSHPSGGGSIFVEFFTTLDDQGQATATFNIPPGLFFSGTEVSFAGLSFHPADLTRVSSTTASVHLVVQ